jgi:hypothetical protein
MNIFVTDVFNFVYGRTSQRNLALLLWYLLINIGAFVNTDILNFLFIKLANGSRSFFFVRS